MSGVRPVRRSRLLLWRDEAKVQLDRLRATLRIGGPAAQRPLPRVGIAVGAWVPGWGLRLAVAIVALVCSALLHPGHTLWVLAGLGALVVLARPSGVAAAVFAFALGFRLAVSPGDPFAATPYLLLFGVHLLITLARVASLTPWTAKIDLQVLVPPVRRFLALQVLVQLLAIAGAAVTASSVTVPWLPVLVGVALTLLAWQLLSRMIPPPRRRSG